MTLGLLSGYPAWRKLLIGLGIALLSFFVFTLAGTGLAYVWLGVNPLVEGAVPENLSDPRTVAALKVIQVFGGGIGLFIVPALLLAWLFSDGTGSYLPVRRLPGAASLFMVVLVLLVSVPLVNQLVEWNSRLALPGALHPLEEWMKDAEADAAELTEAFLRTDGWTGVLVNLLIVALLPAIGEEFLFRGVLQRILIGATRNAHAGIVLTAAVFSAIHAQFYGFLPRMLLGVYFGYLVWWSRSIWLPVIAHFLNNAGAVLVAFLAGHGSLPVDPDTIGTDKESAWLVVSSALLTAVFIGFVRKAEMKDKREGSGSGSWQGMGSGTRD